MGQIDRQWREALTKIASTDAKLARHERLTRIVLFLLVFLAILILGLLIAHMAEGPFSLHLQ
ncbi:hypothetical protein GGR34_003377 [Microvirga flocculans]|uniref:Uncharacterized protein n=1 Tax=Microvirga flocculans TaxID=217168 RepID=A0A7W6IIW4_9HYPH|nr:hypothetical protein [Microvirga flocculans]MBB4041699.1 hypothetical protein [Microvirga flocculans]